MYLWKDSEYSRMKKAFTILILLAVVVGCIIAAGCTETQTPSADKTIPTEVAYTVTVAKEGGTAFNPGAIAAITFKTNPTTGYDWYMVKGNEILYQTFRDVEEQENDIGLKMVGAPSYVTFWLMAEEEGEYPFEFVYARKWDMENTVVSTYSDVLSVVKSDEPLANGPKATFTFDSFNINPPAGSYVKIVTEANPTTGYYYKPSGDGLTIIEDYQVADETLDGSSGQYVWYVTAEKPGDYEFKGTLLKAGSSEEVSAFTVSLKFT